MTVAAERGWLGTRSAAYIILRADRHAPSLLRKSVDYSLFSEPLIVARAWLRYIKVRSNTGSIGLLECPLSLAPQEAGKVLPRALEAIISTQTFGEARASLTTFVTVEQRNV